MGWNTVQCSAMQCKLKQWFPREHNPKPPMSKQLKYQLAEITAPAVVLANGTALDVSMNFLSWKFR